MSAGVVGKERCEELLEYLGNDDAEGLKSMFCNEIASSDNLDRQILDVMDFFEGKVISSHPIVSSERSVRDGKTILKISSHIEEIVTDSGKTYDIMFYSHLTNSYDEDKVGISKLYIKSDDGEDCTVGVLIH
jgi:hypothetical protein